MAGVKVTAVGAGFARPVVCAPFLRVPEEVVAAVDFPEVPEYLWSAQCLVDRTF